MNPHYQIYLWTDNGIITSPLEEELLEKTIIGNISAERQFYQNPHLLDHGLNVGGWSDVMRFEVVYRYGGKNDFMIQ